MFTIASLSSFLLTFGLPFVLLTMAIFIVLFVIVPKNKINSYKRDGVSTYFFPFLGFFALLRQSLQTKNDIMADLKEASKINSNPKFLATNLKNAPFLVLQDPKYVKEFLHKQNNYKKVFYIDVLKPLIGNGLVSSEGETWKRHRKIVSASFNFEFLKSNMPVIQSTTKEFFDKLSPDDLKDYSVISKIQDITGEIVGRIFFGENLNSYYFEGKPLTMALADLTSELATASLDALVIIFGPALMKLPFFPKYRRILQKVKNFRRLCFDIIKDRKSKPYKGPDDLLTSLLATQTSPNVENRFSDEDVVDEFITFFIAGMDTTGHLIGMTLYNLTQHPEYLSQLKAEREVTYNQEKQITTETLSKMEVLHSVLKETLRFYAPAPIIFTRKALCDDEILDLKIKKGDLVTVSIVTSAFDEKNFENPEEFNPGRWLNPESKVDPYAFIPFSAGSRNCIGQHLALIEAKVIISEFLERFEFKMKNEYHLKMMFRFLYEPENEIIFTLKSKSNLKEEKSK